MGQDKISMPSSGGGLMRYYDEYKSKIQISPTAVVIACVIIIIIGIIIRKGF